MTPELREAALALFALGVRELRLSRSSFSFASPSLLRVRSSARRRARGRFFLPVTTDVVSRPAAPRTAGAVERREVGRAQIALPLRAATRLAGRPSVCSSTSHVSQVRRVIV